MFHRTDATQFQDAISGDVRLIRNRSNRWHVWTREAGNSWTRQHKTPLGIKNGLLVAAAFLASRSRKTA
jgi:hypothetical protein